MSCLWRSEQRPGKGEMRYKRCWDKSDDDSQNMSRIPVWTVSTYQSTQHQSRQHPWRHEALDMPTIYSTRLFVPSAVTKLPFEDFSSANRELLILDCEWSPKDAVVHVCANHITSCPNIMATKKHLPNSPVFSTTITFSWHVHSSRVLFLFCTILTGEPFQNLCFPFASVFLPTAAEGWMLFLFMSHELVFWKGGYFSCLQLWNDSISLTKCLATRQQTRWASKAFSGGKFLLLLEATSEAGSACPSQHKRKIF